jgi:hypothetical protein
MSIDLLEGLSELMSYLTVTKLASTQTQWQTLLGGTNRTAVHFEAGPEHCGVWLDIEALSNALP